MVIVGYVVALWFLYSCATGWFAFSSEVEAKRLSLDTAVQGQADALLGAVFWNSILPPVIFALLLFVPYWRLKPRYGFPLLALLLGAAALHWRNTFGLYIFPERFVPDAIPETIWIGSFAFSAFVLAFIAVVSVNMAKCRTSRCT
jgi:hypothetical protein